MLRVSAVIGVLVAGNAVAAASVQVRAFVDKRSSGYNATLVVQARHGGSDWRNVVLGPVALADGISSVRTWGNRVAWVRHSNLGYDAALHCVQVDENLHASTVVLGPASLGARGIHNVTLIGNALAWVTQQNVGYREELNCVVINRRGYARHVVFGPRCLAHKIRRVILTGREIRWVASSRGGDERNYSETLPRPRD